MFDKVIKWLEHGADGEISDYDPRDVRTAVAALYYHMIAEDGVVTEDELSTLHATLMEQFCLSDDRADRLTERAARHDAQAAGLFSFTAIVNHNFSIKKRQEVYDRLSDLAYADGHLHPLELDLLQHIKVLLKLG
ncbi:MAG: hypothetical protein COC23_04780 [Hyphomicrobiales bacterium]|nr:MAG: hypothetical protein COC23_04780 [Hyphomicrobiales bacterium]